MIPEERQTRLAAELKSLRALKAMSSVFDFEAVGEAPESYTLIFCGKGLAKSGSAAHVGLVEQHQVELRLPYAYPQRPPDVRWLTPILHPNVSFSGFITLKDVGLPWVEDLGLDVICERLWDVARLSYLNLEQASNFAAKNWFESECPFELPVDARPLRDRQAAAGSNVIRYERRGSERITLPMSTGKDVLFIGEDTPTPPLPSPAPRRPIRRPPPRDDEVFYIGDD